MKKLILLILILLLVSYVFPGSRGNLPVVLKPEMIKVSADELYVVEGASILVYSLQDLSLKRKIGRQGEGPGELKVTANWYNNVTVFPERILIDGLDKIVFFTKEGKLLIEKKKPMVISQVVPVGKNFAGVNWTYIEDKVQYQCLYLCDENLRKIKELVRQVSPVQSVSRETEMIPDALNFAVWQDKIFVEKSREGFVIDVFNNRGERLYQVKKMHTKIPINEAHKEAAIEKFKKDPFVRQIGFEDFKRFTKLVWPDFLPAIRDIAVLNNKIYVRTYKKQAGKEEWLILDLKGNKLNTLYLPVVDNAPLMAHMLGVKYHSIYDNKLYYIKEKEDTEEWQLHITEIK